MILPINCWSVPSRHSSWTHPKHITFWWNSKHSWFKETDSNRNKVINGNRRICNCKRYSYIRNETVKNDNRIEQSNWFRGNKNPANQFSMGWSIHCKLSRMGNRERDKVESSLNWISIFLFWLTCLLVNWSYLSQLVPDLYWQSGNALLFKFDWKGVEFWYQTWFRVSSKYRFEIDGSEWTGVNPTWWVVGKIFSISLGCRTLFSLLISSVESLDWHLTIVRITRIIIWLRSFFHNFLSIIKFPFCILKWFELGCVDHLQQTSKEG